MLPCADVRFAMATRIFNPKPGVLSFHAKPLLEVLSPDVRPRLVDVLK